MNIPVWLKPGIWGAVVGAVAMTTFGFSYMGWTTSGTAESQAVERSTVAVTSALVPFCVAKAEQDANVAGLAKMRAETSSYTRSGLVQTAGWATMPGMTSPDSALASACSDKLMTAAKS
jgi:hypothetical protein